MIVLVSILVILLTATGQILLKNGAKKQSDSRFVNRFVILGYIAFLVTVFLTYYLMKVIPLKYFIVIINSSYVVVMVGAKIFLREVLTKNRILGTTLIASGVFLFLLK